MRHLFIAMAIVLLVILGLWLHGTLLRSSPSVRLSQPTLASESPEAFGSKIISIPSGEKYVPISLLSKIVTVHRTDNRFALKHSGNSVSLMLDNLFYYNGEYDDEFSTPPFAYDGEVYLPVDVLEHLQTDISISDGQAKLTFKDEAGAIKSITCPVTSLTLAEKTPGCHPLVDFVSGCLFGGLCDGAWLSAETMAKHIDGKETYRLYSTDSFLGTQSGGPLEETEGGSGIFISTGKIVNAIGIDCPWDALPRRPKVEKPGQSTYMDEVTRLASMHGIESKSGVAIHQLIRADIDGDKIEEVIICATNKSQVKGNPLYSVTANDAARTKIELGTHATGTKPGDYAVVIIRKIINDQVSTFIPVGIFSDKELEKGSFISPREYEVAGILDVDGDGQQEILIRETILQQMNMRVLKFQQGRFWHVLKDGWSE